MMADRKPLNALAFALMVVLCMMWGFQQVTIKWTAPDISLVMQAGLRSTIATALLLAWAWARGIPLFERDGTLWPGLAAGAMFLNETEQHREEGENSEDASHANSLGGEARGDEGPLV